MILLMKVVHIVKEFLYREFLQMADGHFASIRSRHPQSFQCRKNCHSCCSPGRTVLKNEAANIVKYLFERPEIIENLRKLEDEDPHRGSRCSFLNAQGECGIYAVRPFICRSHGAPIAIEREGYYQIDVCPLNFTSNPIEELEPTDFFLLDIWNAQLLDTVDDEERIPLQISALLKGYL